MADHTSPNKHELQKTPVLTKPQPTASLFATGDKNTNTHGNPHTDQLLTDGPIYSPMPAHPPSYLTRDQESILSRTTPDGKRTPFSTDDIDDGSQLMLNSFLIGKPLLYFTTLFVSLGVFLFGYDQGVMSSIITTPEFKENFNYPSSAQISNIVAILEIGALLSSLSVGLKFGETYGRRRLIKFGALIFSVGGLIQTIGLNQVYLFVGRFISGIGVGVLSTCVPIYQSEISPPHNRGKLGCVQFTGNIIGYSSSVWIDYFCGSAFQNSKWSWKLPLLLQVFFGMLLFLGTFVIVETPRWLLNHDRDIEGYITLGKLHGEVDFMNSDTVKDEYMNIKETVLVSKINNEHHHSLWYYMKKYKQRFAIGMSSLMFAQFAGINCISYYAPLVFEQAGWVGRKAILMTGYNSIIYVLSTLPPWILIDYWGRKPLLMMGALTMGTSLIFISLSMLWNNSNWTPNLVVFGVIFFNWNFGMSFGPIAWLYSVEIAPITARSAMASASTAVNWFSNWVVGFLTPILQDAIGWKLYLLPATSCFISLYVVWKYYPETTGMKLEDMDSIFNDDRTSIVSLPKFTNENENTSALIAQPLTTTSTRNPIASETTSSVTPMMNILTANQLQTPTTNDILQSDSAKMVQQIGHPHFAHAENKMRKMLRRGSGTISLLYNKVFQNSSGQNIEYGTLNNAS
ncbi:hypothetical protein ACO0RG_002677 [Hanseniaspora osmophila]